MSFIKSLKSLTIPYGSRVWGGATEESDYDYFIPCKNYELILTLLQNQKIEFSRHGSVYYHNNNFDIIIEFTYKDRLYQLTYFEDPILSQAYEQTIHYVNEFAGKVLIQNKKYRHSVFEAFHHILKHHKLSKLENINNFMKEKHPEWFI